MLIWEAPSKRFLTLGPSRVVNPIHTKENKISRTSLIHQRLNIHSMRQLMLHCSTQLLVCRTSHSNITVFTHAANVPCVTYIIRNLKRLIFIEFCIDLLHGKFKGAVSRQSSSFCSILPITCPQSLWNLK